MKYELFGEPNAQGLRRIRALRDIPTQGVKVGDLGGWLQSEHNLSQDGSAWVSANARVYGNALVYGSAQVSGSARVYGSAQVTSASDWLIIGPIGRDSGTLTAFLCKDGIIRVTRGCFYGTLDELDSASAVDHVGEHAHHRAVYVAAITLIRAHFGA